MTTPLRIDKGDNLIAHAVRLLEAAVKAKDAISVSKLAAALMLLSGIRTGSLLTGNIAVKEGSTSHSIMLFKELPSKEAVETPLLCEAKLFVKAANEMPREQGAAPFALTWQPTVCTTRARVNRALLDEGMNAVVQNPPPKIVTTAVLLLGYIRGGAGSRKAGGLCRSSDPCLRLGLAASRRQRRARNKGTIPFLVTC